MNRLSRALLVAVGLSAAAVGSLLPIGALLPAGHVAVVSATLAAPPAQVWARLVDFESQESWRPGLSDVKVAHGAIEETDRWGDTLALAVVERVEGERLVTRVIGGGAFGGSWTVTLAPAGDGTRVEVTERGEIRFAPLRVVARLLFDPTETARTWLADLGRSFGEAPIVEATVYEE